MNKISRAFAAIPAFAVILLLVVFVMIFTGCATKAAPAPDPQASAAEVTQPEPPAQDLTIVQFGEVFTYENGVSISVSTPAPFTPSQYSSASMNPEVTQWYFFKIVLTNNSPAAIEPIPYESVSSGGKESMAVFDMGNTEVGPVGDFPSTSVQPGQTIEWLVGYGLADPAAITFDIQPGFEYEETTFTNILP